MVSSSVAETGVELEAMRKEDSSWQPCQVSLCSTGVGLVVDFGSQDSEYIILDKEEAHIRLRVRSVPLQGDDCSRIEQGEHVLATQKSQFKGLFFDAEVEKQALWVRHSKKVHCRCTFMIKWLHQDSRGGTLSVPSSSIMKLAEKSINIHPTVAAFLNSIKTLSCYDASPFSTVLEDMDCEMDLHKLVEKQIKELNNYADASKKEISEDILLGVEVDTKGQMQCKPVAASRVSTSHVQVPHDQNNLRRSTRSRSRMQVEMEVKDPSPPAPSIQEELSENRSHLSPLAARAAFASLMSKIPQKFKFSSYREEGKSFTCALDNSTPKHVAMESLNGTKSFDCFIGNNMSMTNKISSEIEAASDPVAPEPVEIVKSLISTRRGASGKTRFVEASSGIPTKQGENDNKTSEITNFTASLTCSITERKLSQPTNATRLTRSAIQKGSGIPNDDVNMRTSAEEMKLSPLTNVRRLTRSAVHKEKENLTMEVKQGMDDNKSAQCMESDSSEGNVTVLESHASKKKKPASSSLDTEINLLPIEETNKKRKMSSAVETTQKTEGKVSSNGESSQGPTRKSTSSKKQELRFSPRLRFLPRTRSQNKS